MVKCEICGGHFNERYIASHKRLSHGTKRAAGPAPESERVILLVEDNQDDELLTLRALRKSNLANKIVVVRDGRVALDYLLGKPESTPDLPLEPLPQMVLLDLRLPTVDGLEVLREIRANERTRLLPVVVLTSSNDEQDRVKSHALGINGYARKPVSFSRFQKAVQDLGLSWVVVNDQPATSSGSS